MTPPTERDGMHEDVLETRLRRALNTEATMVHPTGDGLGRIRSGIEEQGYVVWWRRPAVALVAAAMVGLAVGGVAVALGQNDDPPNVVASPTDEPQTSAPPTGSPSPTGSPTDSGGTGPAPASTVDVPVYYLRDDPELGPRLYREFHRVDAHPEGKIATAVSEMFGDRAIDPDYSSSWPATTEVLSVARSGDTATVDLSAFPAVGAAYESVSVQQLVYTVTAADNSVKKVRLLVDGETPQSGHSDWSEPVARAPMVDVQAFIWLLSPTEGSTVGRNVAIEGYGTAFEATINWQVRQGDRVVAEGFTQGGSMGEFGEFSDTVQLEPGTYEMRALEYSPKDGSPTHIDTKRFTVK